MIITVTVGSATIAELNQVLRQILCGFVVILKKYVMMKMKNKKTNCFDTTRVRRDLKTGLYPQQPEITTPSGTG